MVPVIDARRAEVFAARFRVKGEVAVAEGDEGRHTPEALAQELVGLQEPFVLAGTGARRYRAVLEVTGGVVGRRPSSSTPAPTCWPPWRCAAWPRAAAATRWRCSPDYLREADTRINWERRAPRAGVEV